MLKIGNVVINVSLKHEPNHFISPLKTSNEAVKLSTTTELIGILQYVREL